MYVVHIKQVRRYLILLLCVALAILLSLNISERYVKTVLDKRVINEPYAILDAGHGGQDGGAVSENGTCEANINLSIALKTQAILNLCGVEAVLTRQNEQSLDYNPSAGTRQNKNADLYARLAIAENMPGCDFISIHLNKFEQEKYYGAQVFYSANSSLSEELAKTIQMSMVDVLDKNNARAVKPAPGGVMLMKKIVSPAVTVECGFLSNNAEEKLLKSEIYQTKIALAISAGYLNYLKVK